MEVFIKRTSVFWMVMFVCFNVTAQELSGYAISDHRLYTAEYSIDNDSITLNEEITTLNSFGNFIANTNREYISFTGRLGDLDEDKLFQYTYSTKTLEMLYEEVLNKSGRWDGPFGFTLWDDENKIVCIEYDDEAGLGEVVSYKLGQWEDKESITSLKLKNKPSDGGMNTVDDQYFSVLTSGKSVENDYRFNELIIIDLYENEVVSRSLLDTSIFNGYNFGVTYVFDINAKDKLITIAWKDKKTNIMQYGTIKFNDTNPYKILGELDNIKSLTSKVEINPNEYLLGGMTPDYNNIIYYKLNLNSNKLTKVKSVDRNKNVGFIPVYKID